MSVKHNLKSLLHKLTHAVGVSGHEQEIIKIIHHELKDHADEIKISPTGNVVAIKKGSKPGPAMAIGAHMDEVGYVVRNILPNGFLTLDRIGFPPDSVAIGRMVEVSAKRIPGIICIKPGHLQTLEEKTKVTPLDKNFVDIGCGSKAEAEGLGIRIGDPVVFRTEFVEMANPDLVCTRAIDDRIACAIIIELFKTLSAKDIAGTLYGVFTVREEIGLMGACNAVEDFPIDYVIALDTIPVADTPGCNPANDLPIYLGKGPGFPVLENYAASFGGFNMVHPGLREFVEATAKKAKIDLQVVTLAFAGYATDASAFTHAKSGLPVATLAVPRRYSHSPVELMDINDAAGLCKLLQAMIKDNDKATLSFVELDK